MPAAETRRIAGLDTLRLLLMTLGIPYHAALVYSSVGGWLIKAPVPAGALTVLTLLIHSFRMSGFFLLSGLLVGPALRRHGVGVWMRRRSVQLLVPLLVCMVLLTPPQLLLAEFMHVRGHPHPWALAWLATERDLARPSNLWTLHLWFLISLFLISLAAAAVYGVPRDRLSSAAGAAWRSTPPRLAVTLLGLAVVGTSALLQFLHLVTHRHELTLLGGLVPLDATILYGMWFVVGALLEHRHDVLRRFAQPGWLSLSSTVLLSILVVAASLSPLRVAAQILPLLQALAGFGILRCLFAITLFGVVRPRPATRRGADAAYTVYLVHHPIVEGLSVLALLAAVPPLLAWPVTVLVATGLSFGIHEYLIRPFRLTAFLFNGRRFGRNQTSLLHAPVADAS